LALVSPLKLTQFPFPFYIFLRFPNVSFASPRIPQFLFSPARNFFHDIRPLTPFSRWGETFFAAITATARVLSPPLTHSFFFCTSTHFLLGSKMSPRERFPFLSLFFLLPLNTRSTFLPRMTPFRKPDVSFYQAINWQPAFFFFFAIGSVFSSFRLNVATLCSSVIDFRSQSSGQPRTNVPFFVFFCYLSFFGTSEVYHALHPFFSFFYPKEILTVFVEQVHPFFCTSLHLDHLARAPPFDPGRFCLIPSFLLEKPPPGALFCPVDCVGRINGLGQIHTTPPPRPLESFF